MDVWRGSATRSSRDWTARARAGSDRFGPVRSGPGTDHVRSGLLFGAAALLGRNGRGAYARADARRAGVRARARWRCAGAGTCRCAAGRRRPRAGRMREYLARAGISWWKTQTSRAVQACIVFKTFSGKQYRDLKANAFSYIGNMECIVMPKVSCKSRNQQFERLPLATGTKFSRK